MLDRKAISPVVATALLLVVVVVSITAFQNWYGTFETSLLTQVETETGVDKAIRVESLIGNNLFIHSDSDQILKTLKIFDTSGSEKCSFSRDGSSGFNYTRLVMNFDDGSVSDFSEFNQNLTAEGGIDCSSDGITGSGCYFDRVDDTIIIEANSSFNLYPMRSFSFWMNSNISTYSRVLGQADTGATRGNLQIHSATLFGTYNQSGSTHTCNYPGGFTQHNNEWIHIVAIQNRDSGGNSFFKAYVNGELACDDNDVGTISTTFSTDIHIGSRTNKDSYYGGFIDEFSIYSKELSAGDVRALYNLKQALFYEEIIPEGSKGLDVSGCNLENKEEYEVVLFTNTRQVTKKVVKN